MKRSLELRTERKRFSFWIAVIAFMHAVLLFSVLAYQFFLGGRERPLKIVNVSLVSLSGPGGSLQPASEGEPGSMVPDGQVPEAAQDEPPEQAKLSDPEPVTLPVRKAVPEPVKPKIPDRPAVKSTPAAKPEEFGKALDRLRKSVENRTAASGRQSQENLGSALARLQQKVASQTGQQGKGSGGGGNAPSGSGSGRGGGGTADPYKVKIAAIIQKNWEFSSHMLQNSYGMEVYVHIFILPDGTIQDITYDRRAPSAYLNNSVKKALEKSSPLPPLPGDYGSGGASIGFVFTPEGIDL